ncbi:glutaredoxin [Pseudomonas sp.]|uniref:glutaredoxin family protein n=1 Tax=Pseudomonas sp. TaxID=306 RepID=UPI0028A6B26D|nr:glutaredoxin [Pseudomonas sp.]
MIVKALRNGLGQLIVFGDWISRPAKRKRDPAAQAQVDEQARHMALYQFHACPFCVKTRRALHRLNVPMTLRDAKHDEQHRQALLEGGGRIKVPCLRIEEAGTVRWMYESNDIIAYLDQRFGNV